jgi:transposase
MTIMIGIDPHKATHTAVAVDEDEVVLGEFRVSASKAQVGLLCEWAEVFDQREWAVESANGLSYLVVIRVTRSASWVAVRRGWRTRRVP